jgi:transposase
VHDYLERFHAAGLSWPLPAEMSETELERKLFPADSGAAKPGSKALPDFATILEELRRHKHTTLQLLWEEYRTAHPDGYGYSRFCHHYKRWKQERDLVLRQEHRPGEKLFVDWAGDTIPVYDPATGQARPAQLFVAVLGASNYTYAEPRRISRWPVGSARMCAASSSWAVVLSWWFQITPEPAYREPAATSPI